MRTYSPNENYQSSFFRGLRRRRRRRGKCSGGGAPDIEAVSYNMDAFGTDASGNRILIDPTPVEGRPSAIMHTGQGLKFNGVDQQINCGTDGRFGLTNGQSVTWCFDWKYDSSDERFGSFFSKQADGAPASGGYYFFRSNYGRDIVFERRGSSHTPTIVVFTVPNTSTVTYRMIVTWDGTTIKGYANGVIVSENELLANGDLNDPTYEFIFGNYRNSSWIDTVLGNFQMWKDTIWTVADVEADFQNPERSIYLDGGLQTDLPDSTDATKCVSWFPIIEARPSNTINDEVANAAGTIVNYADAMWTSAQALTTGLQTALLEQDANGRVTGLADIYTLNFNGYSYIDLGMGPNGVEIPFSLEAVMYVEQGTIQRGSGIGSVADNAQKRVEYLSDANATDLVFRVADKQGIATVTKPDLYHIVIGVDKANEYKVWINSVQQIQDTIADKNETTYTFLIGAVRDIATGVPGNFMNTMHGLFRVAQTFADQTLVDSLYADAKTKYPSLP